MRYLQLKGLLFSLVFLFFPSMVHAEPEPNDFFAQAIPLNVGYSNAIIDATLTADDDDYYSFTATAGRTYVIEVFNIQGTTDRAAGVWLYNEQETELANDKFGNNGTGETNARLVFTFSTAGTYFIKVKDSEFNTWAGTYSLRVLPKYDEAGAGWDSTKDYEPNDVLELAYLLELGPDQAQTQQIFNDSNLVSPGSDHDYYRFTATAGQSYVFETFDVQSDSSGDGTGLWLYNETGTELANDRHANNGTGNVHARITFEFTSGGTYFLLVKDEDFAQWYGTYSVRACETSCAPVLDQFVFLPLVVR